MPTVKSTATNVPEIPGNSKSEEGGNLLVTRDGSVFLTDENDSAVCLVPGPSLDFYLGEVQEIDDLGVYLTNPEGLTVTLSVPAKAASKPATKPSTKASK